MLVSFSAVDFSDPLFDSFRADYGGFDAWVTRKTEGRAMAHVVLDGEGVVAFLYLKVEGDEIKIGSLKVAERACHLGLGRQAIALAGAEARRNICDSLYGTVYAHHQDMLRLMALFGFQPDGETDLGEIVMRKRIADVAKLVETQET